MKSHNKEEKRKKKTEEGKKKENQKKDKTTQVANKFDKINIKLRIWLCTNNYKK